MNKTFNNSQVQGAAELISFSGCDTMFYYKVNGVLRQALKIWITNRAGKSQSGTVTVFAKNHEPVTTSLPAIKKGRRSYTVFAPSVYPSFGSPISYGAGKHNRIWVHKQSRKPS